jgi:hypothetical protein
MAQSTKRTALWFGKQEAKGYKRANYLLYPGINTFGAKSAKLVPLGTKLAHFGTFGTLKFIYPPTPKRGCQKNGAATLNELAGRGFNELEAFG